MVNEGLFRRLLNRLVLLPVAVMALVAGLLLWQITRLVHGAQAVESADSVIVEASQLTRLIAESQADQRYFLISGDPASVDRFQSYGQRVYAALDHLSTLPLAANHAAVLGEIRECYGVWNHEAFREMQISPRRRGDRIGVNKAAEEELAVRCGAMEHLLKHDRGQLIDRARSDKVQALAVLTSLAVVSSAALSWSIRRQVMRFSRMYAAVIGELQMTASQLRQRSEELEQSNGELRAANDTLKVLAATDGLTDLLNHRAFMQHLHAEFDRTRRYGKEMSLLLLDLDYFKQYNDTYGHPAGDELLKSVAIAIRRSARTSDVVARYGGEEFAVILPETALAGAIEMAERLRTRVLAIGDGGKISISVGVTSYRPGVRSVDEIVSEADQALYDAKAMGRNRTVTHHALSGTEN